MQQSLLTTQDHQWLAKHGEASRLGFDFMLADLLHKGSSSNVRLARAVPIWFEGDYVPADLVVQKIRKSSRSSQIYEQWNAWVFDDVRRICRSLSQFDARVLIVAAGFGSDSGAEIYAASREAVDEARRALYGDDEDHC